MNRLLKKLIIGLVLISINSGAFAGEILMKGDPAPDDGFFFKRDELDKLQLLRAEKDLLKKQFENKIDEYNEPRSSSKAAAFSFLLPGSGQFFYSNERLKGGIMLGIWGTMLTGVIYYFRDASIKMANYTDTNNVDDFNAAADSQDIRNWFIYGLILTDLYSAFDAYRGVKKYNETLDEKKKKDKSLLFYSDGKQSGVGLTIRY